MTPSIFLARQPIVDRNRVVHGYEVLYREPTALESRGSASAETATAGVITGLAAVGFNRVSEGKRLFVNVSRRLLLEGVSSVLPADQVVLELGTDIEADAEVVDACKSLKQSGYRFAIDDFVATPWMEDLVPLASYLKIDVLESSQEIPNRPADSKIILVAKRIETHDRFNESVKAGYDLFQGYFLGRPTLEKARAVPTQHISSLQLLQALNDPDLSVLRLEELVKGDPTLCFLILRTVNSAAYALRSEVSSIRQALVLLGRDTVRRWAALWAVAGISSHAHPELITMATVRARCCEQLGATSNDEELQAHGFLAGLCSLLDAILDQPMPVLLQSLPLPAPVRDALAGTDNAVHRLLGCVTAYENGDWDDCAAIGKSTGVDVNVLPAAYAEALVWASELRRGTKAA